MMKILLVLLCELALGLLSLEWFFNPFNANQSSLIIDNHAKLLDERFEIPKENEELQHDHMSSARTSHGRNLKQRSSEPQLPRFKFRPFESLARNINFRSPSNVFCKHPIKFALWKNSYVKPNKISVQLLKQIQIFFVFKIYLFSVLDRNDNTPKFEGDKPYKFSVSETQRVGQTVFTGIR